MISFRLSLIINTIITSIIFIRYLYIGITFKSLIIRIMVIFVVNHIIIRSFYCSFKKIITQQNKKQKESLKSSKIKPLKLEKIDIEENDGRIIIPKDSTS